MKTFILSICLFLTFSLQANSQAPAIEWQKTYGGSDYDGFGYFDGVPKIINTTDGGYIFAGSTFSNDGDVTGNHGTWDYWVVKINSTGNIQWKKTFGGSLSENPNAIIQTSDGGYIFAGGSNSNDGDISNNHGDYDYWVVKLSSSGNIQWNKTFGGTNQDIAMSIVQTSEGGYIVAGNSASNDGDVSGHHGNTGNLNFDYWIVKLSNSGNIEWQKSFGDSGKDEPFSIFQTTDGGYIVAGGSDSNGGEVTGNHGNYDFWIVKLSSVGNIQWQKSFGGTNIDIARQILQTSDSGYIVVGDIKSNNGDVIGNHGLIDYWVIKLTNAGNIEWQKTLGGSHDDEPVSILPTSNGGYIVAGGSWSDDGDVTGNHNSYDFWIVKLSSTGNIQWQKSLGGTNYDFAYSIIQSTEKGYLIVGPSFSNNGDVTGNRGNSDFWVVKLSCETPTSPTTATANPTNINTGQTSILTASGCASGNTYLWKNGGATVASTASFTTPSLGATTIYTVYCVNGSCVSSGTNVTVNVTQVPFAISPSNQLAICQANTTITAAGCAGTVNWYRDINGVGTTYVSLGTNNPLTYLINSDLTQFIRATCTSGLTTSDYSNYAIIRTGPNVTPQSYIIKAAGSKTLTASGCPVGTTYLWETGETTASVTKSPTAPPSQYPTVYNVKCVSPTCQSSNGFAYIYVGAIVANDDTYSVNIETPLSGNICTNDDPLASKTIQIDPSPTHGNLVIDNSGAFTYTPNTGYAGTDFFEYYMLNGSTLSNYARVTLNIVCPTNLTFSSTNSPSDDISSGIVKRQASYVYGTIAATNKITESGTKVTYQAKNIQLNAGFKADTGAVFMAEVGGCL
jgi:Bacterial Ig domain/Ig-like domain CHU_C associated